VAETNGGRVDSGGGARALLLPVDRLIGDHGRCVRITRKTLGTVLTKIVMA